MVPVAPGGGTVSWTGQNLGTPTPFTSGMPLSISQNVGNPALTQGYSNYSIDPATGQYSQTSSVAPQASDAGSWMDTLIQGASMATLAAAGGLAGGSALGLTGNATSLVGGSNSLFGGAAAAPSAAAGDAGALTYGSVPGSFGGAAGAPVAGDVGAGMGAALPGGATAGATAGGAGDFLGAGAFPTVGDYAGGGALGGAGALAAPGTSFGASIPGAVSNLAPIGAAGAAAAPAGGAAAATGGGLLNQTVNIPGLGNIPLSSLTTGGNLLSSGIGALGSLLGANQLAGSANQATAAQLGMFNTVMGNLAPYMGAGKAALGELGSYLNASETGGPGGSPGLLHQFGPQDLTANLAPNYNFQLAQGQNAIQNQNAATGGAVGGNALTGINAFSQNFASNAYQNAFQNYQTNQNNVYGRLGNLAQLGQASSYGRVASCGRRQFSQGISNTITGAGSALAGGTVGATNAATGGINNLLGYYTLGALTNPNPQAGG